MSPVQLTAAVAVVHWIACVVVLAQALNKIKRAGLWAGRIGLLRRLATFRWLVVPQH